MKVTEELTRKVADLARLELTDEEVKKEADELYGSLTEAKVEVLYDDTDRRAGEKFADSDLLGLPLRVVVSEKTLSAGALECVERATGTTRHRSLSELIEHLTAHA